MSDLTQYEFRNVPGKNDERRLRIVNRLHDVLVDQFPDCEMAVVDAQVDVGVSLLDHCEGKQKKVEGKRCANRNIR